MWDLFVSLFTSVLLWIYNLLGAGPHMFGVAIILFTILIRIVTWPLNAQQMKGASAMQNLQTDKEWQDIQKKYAKDKEKLAQEQMALYKEHGVNPFGGCFPLLIQFPILIGLYQAIIFTLAATPFQLIDLSGRFLLPGLDHLVPLNNLWLGMDLSQPPTNNPTWALALPALVLVTTWAQSKLTVPSTPPSAAKALPATDPSSAASAGSSGFTTGPRAAPC